ncbi:MAG: alcohol dehydrogenase [Spirochaetae bacterium HGW-Spirochaetae-8]|jgi:NADPH:quinone reductase-like Zn-dependent oxidoreductase|nr:MAG: alcohol dehydrogenase [Spirochaetae bacterium HGW-Spirochaetae-8]
MKAVVTIGRGGYEKLVYRDVPVPEVKPGEVLVRVLAAGMNNTEINTRLGWYASTVTQGSVSFSVGGFGSDTPEVEQEGGWNRPTPFPLIQGTDCCGTVVEVGSPKDNNLVGLRVLVRPCMRTFGWGSLDTIWLGSDFDGAFAEFVKVPAREVFPVHCAWSDAELATIPCAYGTAENMIHRTKVVSGETVVVNGASGGVGSAAVQLAKRRGAYVVAVTSSAKRDAVLALGADRVVTREEVSTGMLQERSADVVVDNVAGPGFGAMCKVLKQGGRLTTSGAIAGPMVSMDLRDLYLKDLTLIACTAWDEPVFPQLVSYIERDEIRPLLAGVYPLEDIVEAQQVFSRKQHVGKLVLVGAWNRIPV